MYRRREDETDTCQPPIIDESSDCKAKRACDKTAIPIIDEPVCDNEGRGL